MKRKFLLMALAAFCFVKNAASQDTITVMQYNLLNYGNITYYCPADTNKASDKNNWIRTIVNYVNPTVFTVNEMNYQAKFHDSLLNNALNVNGINYYRKAPSTNIAGSGLINLLYYDSRKVECVGRYVAQSFLRDATVYKMMYKSPDLADGDTIYFYCILVHLKAGDESYDTDNPEQRDSMAVGVMRWIDGFDRTHDKNVMIMGDFNVYTSDEPAYQTLTNYQPNAAIRFYDPINTPGDWNEDEDYASVHTQSTRLVSNDCHSGGGLDDRFDYILVNQHVKENNWGVGYVNGSYRAIGNDGNHFNMSVNQGSNGSVPAAVLSALYNNSDHLPVMLRLAIDAAPAVSLNMPGNVSASIEINPNPVRNNLKISVVNGNGDMNFSLNIISADGRLMTGEHFAGTDFVTDVTALLPGTYVAQITDSKGKILCSKTFIKQ